MKGNNAAFSTFWAFGLCFVVAKAHFCATFFARALLRALQREFSHLVGAQKYHQKSHAQQARPFLPPYRKKHPFASYRLLPCLCGDFIFNAEFNVCKRP